MRLLILLAMGVCSLVKEDRRRTGLWDILADGLHVVRTDLQTEEFGRVVLDLRDGLGEALVLWHLGWFVTGRTAGEVLLFAMSGR